jgi:hypothetical protein
MHKSIPLLLLCLLGCNASSQNEVDRIAQDANLPAATNSRNADPSIFAVPRPNSGTFSTDEATTLLPQFLQRSTPIQKTDKTVTQWQPPTQGIRIHVTADETVEIIDYLGRNLTGLDSVNDALDSTMTHGNQRSVLLTSEVAGWDSATKKALIDILFQPSVQIYLVGNDDG